MQFIGTLPTVYRYTALLADTPAEIAGLGSCCEHIFACLCRVVDNASWEFLDSVLEDMPSLAAARCGPAFIDSIVGALLDPQTYDRRAVRELPRRGDHVAHAFLL